MDMIGMTINMYFMDFMAGLEFAASLSCSPLASVTTRVVEPLGQPGRQEVGAAGEQRNQEQANACPCDAAIPELETGTCASGIPRKLKLMSMILGATATSWSK